MNPTLGTEPTTFRKVVTSHNPNFSFPVPDWVADWVLADYSEDGVIKLHFLVCLYQAGHIAGFDKGATSKMNEFKKVVGL